MFRVAQIREFSNIFLSFDIVEENKEKLIAIKFALTKWIILISPMVPHFAEELWKKLGYKNTLVIEEKWPVAKMRYIKNTNVNIVVQINGKKKLILNIPKDLSIQETQELLLKRNEVKSLIGKHEIIKVIVVPNKIFSLVI